MVYDIRLQRYKDRESEFATKAQFFLDIIPSLI